MILGTKYRIREDLSPERLKLLEEWRMYPGQVVTFREKEGRHLFRVCENTWIYAFEDVENCSFEENLKKILE